MTKLIIALLVVGVLATITPQVYYNYNPVEYAIVTPMEAPIEPIAINKTKTKHKTIKAVKPTLTPEIKARIEQGFGENSKIITAIFMHESFLKVDSKGYNCHYYNKDGKRYSTSCKTVEDRAKAWSVDCGIAQINISGKTCPKYLLTLEGGITAAEKKYKEQGLLAWSSYKNGSYKKYLQEAGL